MPEVALQNHFNRVSSLFHFARAQEAQPTVDSDVRGRRPCVSRLAGAATGRAHAPAASAPHAHTCAPRDVIARALGVQPFCVNERSPFSRGICVLRETRGQWWR